MHKTDTPNSLCRQEAYCSSTSKPLATMPYNCWQRHREQQLSPCQHQQTGISKQRTHFLIAVRKAPGRGTFLHTRTRSHDRENQMENRWRPPFYLALSCAVCVYVCLRVCASLSLCRLCFPLCLSHSLCLSLSLVHSLQCLVSAESAWAPSRDGPGLPNTL